jgi:hypothetical protein
MIRAACHCTAVRFELEAQPAWVLDCNCTICRRYAALWIYPRFGTANILKGPEPGTTVAYLWGDRSIAMHRCKDCGCITHLVAVDLEKPVIMGINARMIPTLDPSKTAVRQVDNGHTGRFWTKSDSPPIESRHPKMPLPGPDDWR